MIPQRIITCPAQSSPLSDLFSEEVHAHLVQVDFRTGEPFSKIASEHDDIPVGQFIRFLKHIKLKKLLSNITDTRDLKKVKYPNDVILQWALSVFFFRRGSNGSSTENSA